jgi:hypothetical protein
MKKLKWIGVGVALIVLAGMLLFFCLSGKEPFQAKEEEDTIQSLNRFCNLHYGEDWGVDSIFPYNDKIVFVVVRTSDSTLHLSMHPQNRVVILEDVKGKPPSHPRIVRY